MNLQGEYTFDGPRDEVWAIVRDPEVLAQALPGAQELEQIGENEYAGKMYVRIGPVSGVFSGKLVVSDEVPPESYTLSVEGRGAPGFGKGVGHVHLSELEDGRTLMRYEGEMQVGGRLAGVGQRMIDSASRSMIRQGLDSLNEALKARLAGEEAEYTPPSETAFAVSVARDMAGEMITSPQVLGALIAVAAALAFVLGYLLGRRGGE